MGPFVPTFISDELSLVIALIIGIAFGYVLEQAGFSSSRRLAGLFYGYDFTVLRVFFTAAITAALGVIFLGYVGLLDRDSIYINPTFLWPAVVGGVIMGAGFILGGYCPGTSIVGAAIGKIDAMLFVLGGFIGVLIFGAMYPAIHTFYESSALGPLEVFDSLHLDQGIFVMGLIAIAIVAFVVTGKIESKVGGDSAPVNSFPIKFHVLAGAALLILGFFVSQLPNRTDKVLKRVSDSGYQATHAARAITTDELVFRLVTGNANLKIYDLRTPKEFSDFALPRSENMTIKDLFGRTAAAEFSKVHVKKVLVAQSDEEARIAVLAMQELGFQNVEYSKGGVSAVQQQYLGTSPVVLASSEQQAVTEYRYRASQKLRDLIKQEKSRGSGSKKAQKRVAGGC
ncbi:MAG: YeeE/YedE family protein [Armatimonadetes bacterium]|nr:YeeE/YedE family protein [Armatimonadota bacterium]